jgi:hypothetical protein
MLTITGCLALCQLQSRLQHIYHGQPYVRVDLNPMSESTWYPCQGHWIWPQSIALARLLLEQGPELHTHRNQGRRFQRKVHVVVPGPPSRIYVVFTWRNIRFLKVFEKIVRIRFRSLIRKYGFKSGRQFNYGSSGSSTLPMAGWQAKSVFTALEGPEV